jgi:hypothetical protein
MGGWGRGPSIGQGAKIVQQRAKDADSAAKDAGNAAKNLEHEADDIVSVQALSEVLAAIKWLQTITG